MRQRESEAHAALEQTNARLRGMEAEHVTRADKAAAAIAALQVLKGFGRHVLTRS